MGTKLQDEQAASSPFPGFHNVLMTPPVCSPLLSVPRSWGDLLSSFTPLVLFTNLPSPPYPLIPPWVIREGDHEVPSLQGDWSYRWHLLRQEWMIFSVCTILPPKRCPNLSASWKYTPQHLVCKNPRGLGWWSEEVHLAKGDNSFCPHLFFSNQGDILR